MRSRSPFIAVAAAIAMTVVVPGCSDSQPARPTRKIVKHTFYGYDPDAPDLHQREVLSWTSQGDNGPIDGTYTIQDQANDKGPWTTLGKAKPFQGTQHGNEINVPRGQIDGIADLQGAIQQNGHRLHLNLDLGIETNDLYDSPSAIPVSPTSQPPTFTTAGWFYTHPIAIDDSILETALRSGAITITGMTGSDWGNRKYTGGLNEGWFLVYSHAAVSAGRVRAGASDCTMPVQGHPDYCIGAEAYNISLSPADNPLGEGTYQATKVMLFDQNSSQIDTDSGRVPAGQKFRVILESRMLEYQDTFRPGDIAVVWLDSTKRDGIISGIKELPVDAFLPVTS